MSGQDLKTLTAEDEVILKKGRSAPYFGVLVPEDRYRTYQEQLEICDIFKDFKHPLPEEQCDSCVPGMFWASVAFLAVGFAGGVLLVSPK